MLIAAPLNYASGLGSMATRAPDYNPEITVCRKTYSCCERMTLIVASETLDSHCRTTITFRVVNQLDKHTSSTLRLETVEKLIKGSRERLLSSKESN